ncbi:calcium-binding protein [Acuticoccus kandeliae]|uniref:calcium-binding protein n=1 Tax=Acuticoccus kandeliae TaxID=2073160 RepID=UPI0013006CED|nr:calcium-binding protein [Acuticoccus kandeliae]
MVTITDRITTPVAVRNEDVLVTETGRVRVESSKPAIFDGVDFDSVEIRNDGFIRAADAPGVLARAADGTTVDIYNSGRISGEFGVKTAVQQGDDPIRPGFDSMLVNSGLIVGRDEAAVYLQGADDTVINNGRIHGNVILDLEDDDDDNDDIDAAGNDFYRGNGDLAGTLNMGGGNDRVDLAGLITQDVFMGSGADTLIVRANGQILGEVDMGIGSDDADKIINKGDMHDAIFFGDGPDSYKAIGDAFSGTVNGAGGNDTMRGGNANDTFFGAGDDDVLIGDRGNDFLQGGEGNDVIVGGIGRDTMTGGADRDRFVFERGDGRDLVSDFDVTDKLDLRDYDLNYNAVMNATTTYSDATVIRLFGDTIILAGYTDDLVPDQFLF